MRLALYQPDIPPNTGAMLRLAACFGVSVDIIEPCGFPFSDRDLRRAGMDYIDHVDLRRHESWDAFVADRGKGRLVLLTTQGSKPYTAHRFAQDDILLVGRETAGVPDEVHEAADARLVVPMAPHTRSINVALASAIVLGEALRQTDLFPRPQAQEA